MHIRVFQLIPLTFICCTDYYSGRSDRVSVEWLLDELSDLDSDIARVMEIPDAATFFGAWMEKLNDMIHHADAENWTVAG